ncbi:DNA mismatch repair protein MutL [Metschnikowia bicuspidata var. bicuspidata NRRL YB-4993]|uniref:DNA mismatch repair protein MutL n=1 Tax=Metschnikowia bicuspidata var. bicuspidata NRRL YB-4993 TaxID=869754 RepID=A0A1A0H639_9ASCO|nr:DNA mismatch repair protein MutL [Metschnikowia bicuspidata var. bicuspidata NRRL YB-4993]OBA19383.1 DNA mismatch repair protein MutL [Metschnikowia bicuspidata var. bicuspidata NRRL YB-4993]
MSSSASPSGEKPQETAVPKIRKLDASVVNRIAAGEIIVQPANALKEMLENSIDANASTIDVVAKDGGLKWLQITDNGSGIHYDDLGLLCERFATSKLRSFNDLLLISTYGFRGEALASISHISHLSVVSKVAPSALAYKSFYLNGKLCSPKFKPELLASAPKPVAGKDGTQITVEDLFYNLKSRLRALKSKNEEWVKILDVVGKYAIHTEGVGFTCKKFGDSLPAVSTRPQAPLKERVRTVFGTSVASDLIEFDFPGPDFGLVKFKGAVSGFNYNNKRRIAPTFFINNRLVACDPLRRAIQNVFLTFLPKGNHPFVYLSLDIEPQNLDVNIHPTKREVRFLNEDEIIEWISGQLNDVLFARQGSRTFKQSTLKRLPDGFPMDETTNTNKKHKQVNKLVRVDVSQLKINQFVRKDFDTVVNKAVLPSSDQTLEESVTTDSDCHVLTTDFDKSQRTCFDVPSDLEIRKPRQEIHLDSVVELREELSQIIHRPLTNIFNNLVNVGLVDANKRLSCFQYDVNLFLCDYGAVLNEFYYQVALSDFANYGEYVLEKPLGLRQVLEPLYETHFDLVDIESVINQLMSLKDMFSEYFQIEFSEETLVRLPMLLKGIKPSNKKIPFFVYRLGTKVDYLDEKQCFAGILRQLALLYVPDRISRGDSEEEKLLAMMEEGQLSSTLEHVIYPEIRKRFIAPENLVDQVVQVADLPGLYKVFERC